jgi:hypothetical protein
MMANGDEDMQTDLITTSISLVTDEESLKEAQVWVGDYLQPPSAPPRANLNEITDVKHISQEKPDESKEIDWLQGWKTIDTVKGPQTLNRNLSFEDISLKNVKDNNENDKNHFSDERKTVGEAEKTPKNVHGDQALKQGRKFYRLKSADKAKLTNIFESPKVKEMRKLNNEATNKSSKHHMGMSVKVIYLSDLREKYLNKSDDDVRNNYLQALHFRLLNPSTKPKLKHQKSKLVLTESLFSTGTIPYSLLHF